MGLSRSIEAGGLVCCLFLYEEGAAFLTIHRVLSKSHFAFAARALRFPFWFCNAIGLSGMPDESLKLNL